MNISKNVWTYLFLQDLSKLAHESGGKLKDAQTAPDENKASIHAAESISCKPIDSLPLSFFQPKRDKMSGLSRKAKRRKMIAEEDKEYNDSRAIDASIRSAKKANRPDKIGVPEKRPTRPTKKKSKSIAKKSKGGSAFESDFGQKSKSSNEGIRARKDDAIKSSKKGGVGGKTKKKGPPKRK